MTKKIYLVILLFVFTMTYCNSNKTEDIEINVPKSPFLNKTDSLLMIEIYNKIGPWGSEWDLHNIETWGGVQIALDLSVNQYRITGFNYFGWFKGRFPDEFRELTELRILGLGGGTLTGEIPTWIGELKNLEMLYLGYNQMYGNIPASIGQLKNLRQLTIGENFINGNLPEELGNLTNLEQLTISNTQISGKIPSSLAKLSRIKK